MPYMTNGKRNYKREYAAILLRRKNNKEYDAKYKKDAAARSLRSWHKHKTPEKLAVKRLYIKEYSLKYPERRKLTSPLKLWAKNLNPGFSRTYARRAVKFLFRYFTVIFFGFLSSGGL